MTGDGGRSWPGQRGGQQDQEQEKGKGHSGFLVAEWESREWLYDPGCWNERKEKGQPDG